MLSACRVHGESSCGRKQSCFGESSYQDCRGILGDNACRTGRIQTRSNLPCARQQWLVFCPGVLDRATAQQQQIDQGLGPEAVEEGRCRYCSSLVVDQPVRIDIPRATVGPRKQRSLLGLSLCDEKPSCCSPAVCTISTG